LLKTYSNLVRIIDDGQRPAAMHQSQPHAPITTHRNSEDYSMNDNIWESEEKMIAGNPFRFSDRETDRAIAYLNREVPRVNDADYIDMVSGVVNECDDFWYNVGIEIWNEFTTEPACSSVPRLQCEMVDWSKVSKVAIGLARLDYLLVEFLSDTDLEEMDEQFHIEEWGENGCL
jgi:hypothetical protein